jgi:hypothetical protein
MSPAHYDQNETATEQQEPLAPWEVERPKLPVFRLNGVYDLRDKIYMAIDSYFDGDITGAAFEDLVSTITTQIPKAKYSAVYESVKHLAGTDFTPAAGFEIAWRLAGNAKKLQQGVMVPPWCGQVADEWVPLQVRQYKPFVREDGKGNRIPGGLFRMRILSGTPCPMLVSRFWSAKFCKLLSSRLGFTAPWNQCPYVHPMQLVNLHLAGKMSVKWSRPGHPTFREAWCTDSMLKSNRDILRKRFRIGWRCPHGYHHYCHQCRVGYNDCPAGCHPNTIAAPQSENDSIT